LLISDLLFAITAIVQQVLVLLIFSVGLAYPLTKIRTARYFASHTTLSVAGGLDSFTAEEKSRMNAMGEEMADAFDVEFDIGV